MGTVGVVVIAEILLAVVVAAGAAILLSRAIRGSGAGSIMWHD